MQALQARDLNRALTFFANAGDPATVADEVQNRREDEADNLLQMARTAYAQAGATYDDLKREVQAQYLDPAWIIGREFHREMVQRFFDQIPTEKLDGAAPGVYAPVVTAEAVDGASPGVSAPVVTEEEEEELSEAALAAASGGIGERRALLMLGGVVLLLFLFGGGVWAFGLGPGSPPAPAQTASPTATSQATDIISASITNTAAAAGSIPGEAVTPSPAVTASATPTPTAAPEIIGVISVDPTTVFTDTLPITFTVRGSNLNQIQNAQLVADNRPAIQLNVASGAPSEATLTLNELPEALNGEVPYELQINGDNYREVALRDYIEIKEVKGVKIEYRYTGRVAEDETGPFTAMRKVRDVDSERIGVLRNGDLVDILRDEGDGWYQVRIRESSDPDEIGKVGWIERWLVDDNDEVPTPAPPPPTSPPVPTPVPRSNPTPIPQPQVRFFDAAPVVSYAGSGESGRFESCVTGSVTGSEGPIVGAVVNVNNGENFFDATTGGGGNFRVCGLGASNWTAVLYFVPGTPIGNQPAVAVYVNGLPAQHTVVSFTQR
ncbi:MAG: SH3 domain-containing protein [Chloroflexaceae bacterium]